MSAALHASATMPHKVGTLDKATKRGFDARHRAVRGSIEPVEIKQLREADIVSSRCSRAV